jgi:hypothetical protein
MKGYIKLHREITDHWIWSDPIKFKWWVDLLLLVNHSTCKVNIGNQLYDCNRGQVVMSLQNFSERWHVSRDSVRAFLNLLKKDGMIEVESLTVSTQITVCNYDNWQSDTHTNQTQTKRKPSASRPQADINNNVKNVKNTTIPRVHAGETDGLNSEIISESIRHYENLVQHIEDPETKKVLTGFSNYLNGKNEYKTRYVKLLSLKIQLQAHQVIEFNNDCRRMGIAPQEVLTEAENFNGYTERKDMLYPVLKRVAQNLERKKLRINGN